jgi:hypothetical protein
VRARELSGSPSRSAGYVAGMTAKELADQAIAVAEKLKPGTWEAVQALALASIAQSLVSLAEKDQSN